MLRSLVGSEMCIRDRATVDYGLRVLGWEDQGISHNKNQLYFIVYVIVFYFLFILAPRGVIIYSVILSLSSLPGLKVLCPRKRHLRVRYGRLGTEERRQHGFQRTQENPPAGIITFFGCRQLHQRSELIVICSRQPPLPPLLIRILTKYFSGSSAQDLTVVLRMEGPGTLELFNTIYFNLSKAGPWSGVILRVGLQFIFNIYVLSQFLLELSLIHI